MMDYDEDEHSMHEEQMRKNRQGLMFVFILMVGIVILGDQDDDPPGRRRPRGPGFQGSNPFMPPLVEESLKFNPNEFKKVKELYSFKTISPPGIWNTTDTQYGDAKVVTRHELDRPLGMAPNLLDLFLCPLHEAAQCRDISGSRQDPLRFINLIENETPWILEETDGCDCKAHEMCGFLSRGTGRLGGSGVCVPRPMKGAVGVEASPTVLFYYSLSNEERFQEAIQKKTKCLTKRKELTDIFYAQIGEETDSEDGIASLLKDNTIANLDRRVPPPQRINLGDFYSLCGTRIDLKASDESTIHLTTQCRTFVGYREVTTPFLVLPVKGRQGDLMTVVGLNYLGNLTVQAYPRELILDQFNKAFAGENPLNSFGMPNLDEECNPSLGGMPRVAYLVSFNGMQTGWVYRPDHQEGSPLHLTIVGDGGQWFSSRITFDLTDGRYYEGSVYVPGIGRGRP